jgi:hypothetical protein
MLIIYTHGALDDPPGASSVRKRTSPRPFPPCLLGQALDLHEGSPYQVNH